MKKIVICILSIMLLSCNGVNVYEGYPFVELIVYLNNKKVNHAFISFNSHNFNNCNEQQFYYSYIGIIRPEMYEYIPIGGQSYIEIGINTTNMPSCRTLGEYYNFIGTDTFNVTIFSTKEEGYEWRNTKADSLILYKKVFTAKETGRDGKNFVFIGKDDQGL